MPSNRGIRSQIKGISGLTEGRWRVWVGYVRNFMQRLSKCSAEFCLAGLPVDGSRQGLRL